MPEGCMPEGCIPEGCMHDDAVQVQNYRVIRGVPRNPGILL